MITDKNKQSGSFGMRTVLLSCVFMLVGAMVLSSAYGDAIKPVRQMGLGFTADQVVCNEDLVKMLNPAMTRAVCVISSSEQSMTARGWIKAPDLAPDVAEIQDSVKTVAATKIESVGAKKSTTAVYDYVFEVCAGSIDLVAPEVIVKSDVQTKSLVLADDVPANACLTSVTQITAVESSSIKPELTRQDEIVAKIDSLRKDVAKLTADLDQERIVFATTLAEQGEEKKQKMDDSIVKMNELRKNVSDLKDMINRYYVILYGSSMQKTASATPLKGVDATVKVMSTTPSKSEKYYDVVIEVCGGQKTVTNPVVELATDTSKQSIKVAKAVQGICYLTGAKAEAASPDSISVKFADSVLTTLSLENMVIDLDGNLAQKRAELLDLTQNNPSPDAKKIRQLSEDIAKLRQDTIRAKLAYYESLK